MKKIINVMKKAVNWYIDSYAFCYKDRYDKYAYRIY